MARLQTSLDRMTQISRCTNPTHIHTLNLAIEDGLEFPDLHRGRPGHATSSLDFGHLEIAMEFDSKDAFWPQSSGITYNLGSTSSLHTPE